MADLIPTTMVPIQYRGFWDVPRIFLARYAGRLFLFDCPFSQDLDDYPDDYTVYELPFGADADLPTDWTTLVDRAIGRVGLVPVSAVRFDPTRRQAIDLAVFAALQLQPVNAPSR